MNTFTRTLSFHNIITEPNWDDCVGLMQAYREGSRSSHTTQVGAHVRGIEAHNFEMTDGVHAHAESWAIATAARLGVRLQDSIMYAPWACCVDCAVDIAGAGIKRVVMHSTVMDLTPPRWQHSIQRGLDLLFDRGVRLDLVEKELGMKIKFDGKEVEV